MGKTSDLYDALSDVQLREFYNAWVKGEKSKFDIEEEIGDGYSRGQGITRAWRGRLGIETKGVDWKDLRIAELEEMLEEMIEKAERKKRW
mgnify:CR=1 FL=1